MSGTSNVVCGGVAGINETSFADWSGAISPTLNEQELHRRLREWNDTASDFPRNRCVHDLFAEQVAETPNAIALVIGDEYLSYADLDAKANQVAHHLRSIGVGPEVIVGLCIERSIATMAGMLGILKAGGAYLPLDKNYPRERIAYLLKDANVSTVLTSAETEAALAGHDVRTVRLDFNSEIIAGRPKNAPVSGAKPENLAYLMYTSGSSGNPKGVGVAHYNINRLVKNTNYVQIASSDVFLQLAPVTFDASTFEIWGALLNGARLVLYPPDPMLDLLKLKNLIHTAKVSILWLTAGLFHSIVNGDLLLLAPIRQLLAGGDVVSATHVKRVLDQIPGCRVINGYGPTEGTTFSVCFPVSESAAIDNVVPIGRPVSNTSVYVLDSNLQPVLVSATGELHIGGAGLARGYLNRPDLTAESFIPNPFDVRGTRLYRTGDITSYSDDGVLEFVGRLDFQVKVSGYRIELEEVEAALLLEPNVRQAAVSVIDVKGDKRLTAYIVGADGVAPDTKKLRAQLSQRLPEYMVPSFWVALKALPLTTNGKVDRKALPLPEGHSEKAAAKTGTAAKVAEIWASVLRGKEPGLDDDFFELGGTSLALINIVVEMSKRFGIPLDTGIVTGGATVSALAHAVEERLLAAAAKKKSSEVEQAVAQIWTSVLGGKEPGIDDDFFELGGTSLALINIVVEMSKRFGIPLDTGIVTGGATVRALACAVEERLLAAKKKSSEVEQAVAQIWASVLGGKEPGIDDDFFELGGTSLALINIVVEMSKRFGIPLDTGIVTSGATVKALARAVEERLSAAATKKKSSEVEQAVAQIWASVLGGKEPGLDDDFFELGGTSLALINIVVEMSKRFGIPLDTGIVTGGATVSALARAVEERLLAAATKKKSSEVEQAVAQIWASVLGGKEPGIDDDFFELGGTSLALINIVVEMSKRFGVPLDMGIVTGGATVSALARAVEERLLASATKKKSSEVEQAVAQVWTSVLGGKEPGIDDDFFELGGTSLALINIVVEMSKRFGVPLDTGIVTGGATVSALARAVEERLSAAGLCEETDEQVVAEVGSSM